MIEIPSKVIVIGLFWVILGSLVNRFLGVESLQFYVILSLIILFIRYGTTNRKRLPGEASSYSFLTANVDDLANEIVPFVSPERLKRVLNNVKSASSNSGEGDAVGVPNENTAEGAQLRKMVARQKDIGDAVAIADKMKRLDRVPDFSDLCLCGSERKFGKCCSDLTVWLMKKK